VRNIGGAVFPLFTSYMYKGMTYQWCFSFAPRSSRLAKLTLPHPLAQGVLPCGLPGITSSHHSICTLPLWTYHSGEGEPSGFREVEDELGADLLPRLLAVSLRKRARTDTGGIVEAPVR
jgi:hypothetical protein